MLVGNDIAKLSIPEAISSQKTLTVLVNSSIALEFQYMIPSILERIESLMGYKAIKNIKIRQGSIKIKDTIIKNYKNQISVKEKEKIKALVNDINNDKLKENIKKFASSFFTNFK